jgi:hypothetical protein
VIDMARKELHDSLDARKPCTGNASKRRRIADLRGQLAPVCLLTSGCLFACASLCALQGCNNAHRNRSQE